MEIERKSLITVDATIESLEDLYAVQHGYIPDDLAKKVFVTHAVVDPKAVFVSLPALLMTQLGLSRSGPVRLTIQGRSCSMDVKELAEDGTPIFGHTVLTLLDLVVDVPSQTLIGNPAHGGVWTYELYCSLSNSVPECSPSPTTEPIA